MRRFIAVGLVAWSLLAGLVQIHGAEPTQYRAGVAQVDITPDYPIRLSGFGFRRQESEGVTQRIWTKALAVQAGSGDVAVLVTTDNLGVPYTVTQEVASRLQKKAGLKPERFTVTATHTHTAPMLTGVAPTLYSVPIPPEHQAHIDRYTKELTDKIEEASLAAIKGLEPCQLLWGIGSAKFAINRRTSGGPVDHDLPILVVKDAKGQVRAIYANYACHCVTLSNNKLSGDWAGYAADLIQREFPQATALISVGCGADSNPSSGVTGDKVDVAERQGLEIASEVKRLVNGFLAPVEGDLTIRLRPITLDFAPPPSREEFAERVKKGGYIGYHAQVQLARLDRGEALQTTLNYPVQTWSFGKSLAMVFLPGEVVVDYSLRLKRELDGQRLWVVAYANDEPCYIPSERVLKEGGYEGGDAMTYYDRPSRLQAGLEQKIVDAVRLQIDKDFAAKFDAKKTMGSLPKSPQQSLATLKTSPDLQVELVVSEPLISDPVAIDFGPDGDIWVAEMHDYPSGITGNFEPGGRVRLVEDVDGDGQYDKSSVFLKDIPFPTGITVWRDGVLVCAAPDILFARDTNGDGQADDIKKVYSGFGTGNFQARVNSLQYGLDGWVYGSCGLFGGKITNFKGQEFELGDRDFRIKPDTGELEPATGRTQQGRVRDDWGNWFGCDSGTLCRHYPLADHYLRRNPHLVAPPSGVYVPADAAAVQLIPATQQVQRFKLSGPANNVTAACGLGIYRDTLLGPGYQGNAFTCEPVNLLVHRLKLSPAGCTFQGHRGPEEANSEFLSGTDEWFRPVQAITGPDGGLWVADMYRYVIEHPRWIPPEDLAKIDARAGHSLGRIYRVRPRNTEHPKSPQLQKLDGPGLVAALETDNGWQRDLAGRMLIWKYGNEQPAGNSADVSAVVQKLTDTALKSKRALSRLQALCVLDVLGQVSTKTILQALRDTDAGVRRHAVQVAETRLMNDPQLGKAVASLIDPDPQVTLQQAYSLAALPDIESGVGLYMIAESHAADPYIMAAVMSSLRKENIGPLLDAAIVEPQETPFHQHALNAFVGQAVQLGATDNFGEVIEFLMRPRKGGWQTWQLDGIAEVMKAVDRKNLKLTELGNAKTQLSLKNLLAKTLEMLRDDQNPTPVRVAALQFVGRDPSRRGEELQALGSLLVPQTTPQLQAKVIETLGQINVTEVPGIFVANWGSLSPARQSQIIDLLLARPAWTVQLLGFIEEQKIAGNQIDAARRQRLLTSPDKAIRTRSEKLLAGATNPDRLKVMEAYREVTTLPGNVEHGQALFTKTCATCHRLGTIGQAVGPDLAALANKPPQFFLQEILDPNRNVDSRYVQYSVALKDGRVQVGLLASESGNSLVLRNAEGKEVSILRSEIDEVLSTGKSLMPEGLERDLNPAAIADIIAFVTHNPAPAKQFAGNEPGTVTAVEGRLALLAKKAEIRGNQIVFEEPFQNLGFWHGADDHATWNVQLDRTGEFDVYLDYACDQNSAGNDFVLTGAMADVSGKVAATGGWDQYRQQKVGTVSLAAGPQRLTLRPAGEVLHGALLDLKGVHLVPKGEALAMAADIPKEGKKEITPKQIRDIAVQIIDDKIPQQKRIDLIAQHPKLAGDLISAMTDDLSTGTPEEYRRIPWIWRVAIAAGKRNDSDEIRSVLQETLPQPNSPLHDWRAVVVGGGIINGISLEGFWPHVRIKEILKDQEALKLRWQMTLAEAAKVVEDEKVPTGTRYDALRIVALDTWERCGKRLAHYLAPGVNEELQQGAVSGLVDVDNAAATQLLIKAASYLSEHNRQFAVAGLLRGEERQKALIQALETGAIKPAWLKQDQRDTLLKIKDEVWQERADKVLK